MRVAAFTVGLGMLLQAAPRPTADTRDFRYVRGLELAAGTAGAACAPLDAAAYAHAQPALADLRIFAGAAEVPYALTLSETARESSVAKILNRGVRGGHIVFDLEMPARAYTEVKLDIDAEDLVAKARVTGVHRPGETEGVYLGTFTLFDLTAQNLTGNSLLPLAESTYPYLHVDLQAISGTLEPDMVRSAAVPPSREAQTLYTTVAQTATITQRGAESVATFKVPARVPVERIAFDLAPADKAAGSAINFSRDVSIRARAEGTADAMTETVEGEISRVKMTVHGQQLNLEHLSVPATVGSNAQAAADLEVVVDNGDDRPLALQSVRLEMRERRLCFDAPAAPASVYYGDAMLRSPVYDYSRIFNPAAAPGKAALGPERENPQYQPAVVLQPFTERHPALLWAALLAAVAVLGGLAVRSARRIA